MSRCSSISRSHVTSSLPNSPIEARNLTNPIKNVSFNENLDHTNVAGLLPSDFPMARSFKPNVPQRSPRRNIPSPIITASKVQGVMQSMPTTLSTESAEVKTTLSTKASPPSSPLSTPCATTLAAIFGQMAVHPRSPPDGAQSCLRQSASRKAREISQPELNVRFDDIKSPIGSKLKSPTWFGSFRTLPSSAPFSPSTPKAMYMTAPWMVDSNFYSGSDSVNNNREEGMDDSTSQFWLPKEVPANKDFCSKTTWNGQIDADISSGLDGGHLDPSYHTHDAPMLILPSETQDSLLLYDREAKSMTEINSSTMPPWSKTQVSTPARVDQQLSSPYFRPVCY
jgi:hypothetical protein